MTDLEQILGDPNLRWLVDSAVNKAGEKVPVRNLEGKPADRAPTPGARS